MDAGSLECLPDELLLDVVEHLDTARDVAHLEASCRRTRTLIQHEGWRTFTRHSFRTLDLPLDQKLAWGTLARRLTYQHECWEKRGFQVFEFQEQASRNRRAQANVSGRPRQSVAFYPVLDARALRSTHDELAVWGLGEDLITQVKTATHGSNEPQWYVAKGHEYGYSAGFGDVTAVSIVDRHDAPQVVIGRANGDVQRAHATGDKVGGVVQMLSAPTPFGAAGNGDSRKRKSPGQSAVSWLEWQPLSNIVASSTNSTVALYNLNSADEETLTPSAHYDVSLDSLDGDISLVRSVKFMGKDTIACALGGSRHPLRWAKVTPTGLVFSKAAENPGLLDYMATKSDITTGEKTTVRAIEAVGHGTNDSLLLSAWDDGTYRLTDVRTPSPYDAVYRDRWDPYEAGSSLAVYGTDRFVAGSNISVKLYFFDFRYPKPYHYSTARPCSPTLPSPYPPFGAETGNAPVADWADICDHQSGTICNWHGHMRMDHWRPDGVLMLRRRDNRVHSLAKASDTSDSLYLGVQGSVMEMVPALAQDETTESIKRTAPTGWHVGMPLGRVDMIESGVSLCKPDQWKLYDEGDPHWHRRLQRAESGKQDMRAENIRCRLDRAYGRKINRERCGTFQ